jgi:FAD/FMN-containing dehydrogenase
MGGMLGNNSCGTTSISVGSTRDHTLEVHCVLADGSEAVFKELDWSAPHKNKEGLDFNSETDLASSRAWRSKSSDRASFNATPSLRTNVATFLRKQQSREGAIYEHVFSRLEDTLFRDELAATFPRPDIQRRNTGYALDLLARQFPFDQLGPPFNLATLLAG